MRAKGGAMWYGNESPEHDGKRECEEEEEEGKERVHYTMPARNNLERSMRATTLTCAGAKQRVRYE